MRVKQLFIIATVFIFLLSFSYLAADEADNPTNFVDLDGDGIDDNAPDDDRNGIPDQAEVQHEEETEQFASASSVSAFQMSCQVDLSSFLSNSEKFGERMFSTRAQSCFRGGFDAGDNFGVGNGIGSGAVSGGCPGGVCH